VARFRTLPYTCTDWPTLESVGARVDLLVFSVGEVRYALLAEAVREVVRAVAITPLPDAPRIVEGVIDLRGTVTPVLDLRRRLGARTVPASIDEHFIVAEAGSRPVVFRADPGTELAAAPDDAVEQIDALVRGTGQVTGVVRLSTGVVLLYDLAAFLSAAESEALDHALAAEAGGGGGP
jgi:purine-binding chemotaxis protein CheW